MKWIISAFTIIILSSLLSALIPLFGREKPEKMVKILTVRVTFSIAMFALLLVVYWIKPSLFS